MEMTIGFPGPGLEVTARFGEFEVRTDQPNETGGAAAAPGPFDLFLASLGTCAGYYVLRFLRERGLTTEGVTLGLETERAPGAPRISRVRIRVSLPPGFPLKYRRAVAAAVNACTVKKLLLDPPAMTTLVEVNGHPVERSDG